METIQCPICRRPLGEKNISKHHLKPKSEGGKHSDTIFVHNICHQKIHSVFTEKDLLAHCSTVDSINALCSHEEMQKFINWVSKKDPAFYQRNRWTRTKRMGKK